MMLISCDNKPKNESNKNLSTNESWEIKEDNYAFTIEILDSVQFYAEQKAVKHETKEIEKITDLATAKKMLNGVVEFKEHEHYTSLRRIFFRNGDIYNSPHYEEVFVAYYPTEDIILFDGYDDISFNLTNGKHTEETGNPDYIVASPNNQFRLNGYLASHECLTYFIQKNVDGQFEKVIPLNEAFIRNDRVGLCQVNEVFWTDDNTLFLKEVMVFDANDDLKQKYYKVSITKAEPKPAKPKILQSKNPSDFIPEGYVLYKEEGIGEIRGDLNKDGLEDIVLIIKGTDKNNIIQHEDYGELDQNRRGIIILFNKGNHYELAVKNYDCFYSENEDGGNYFAPELYIEIEKGNLYIKYAHGRYGNWYYTFRYQNRDFELIGYDSHSNRGPVPQYETSINFLTKKKLTRDNLNKDDDGDNYEVNFEDTWEDISIQELTRLSEIRDFDRLNREF